MRLSKKEIRRLIEANMHELRRRGDIIRAEKIREALYKEKLSEAKKLEAKKLREKQPKAESIERVLNRRKSWSWSTKVYFIVTEDEKFMKIGIAKSIRSRLKELQTSCPLKLKILGSIKGDPETEVQMQDIFHKYRIHGGWFAMDSGGLSKANDIIEFWETPEKEYLIEWLIKKHSPLSSPKNL